MQSTYETVPGNAEWPGDYKPGGLHPIHLGDKLDDRYTILRKLGNGKYATVWLARRETRAGSAPAYVTLKVTQAQDSESAREEDILELLNRERLSTSSSATDLPVQALHGAFQVYGPNGMHRVLVLEPLGQTLADMYWRWLLKSEEGQITVNLNRSRAIARQMTKAVAFAHSKGVVHGDVQLGNFMFGPSKLSKVAAESDGNETFSLVRRDGGPIDKHAPSYLVEPRPLDQEFDGTQAVWESHRLVLIDFGAATLENDAVCEHYAYPINAVAPELVLKQPASEKSDVWALGCSIYRLVASRDLFFADAFEKGEKRVDEYVQSMTEVLGPMPESVLCQWDRRPACLAEDGTIIATYADNPFSDSVSAQLAEMSLQGATAEEIGALSDFIRCLFQWDPADRPAAADLLDHPWLQMA